jgi:hypothetical protein
MLRRPSLRCRQGSRLLPRVFVFDRFLISLA